MKAGRQETREGDRKAGREDGGKMVERDTDGEIKAGRERHTPRKRQTHRDRHRVKRREGVREEEKVREVIVSSVL